VIIHLSQARYERIRKQGFPLLFSDVSAEKMPMRFIERGPGDTEFHLLNGEHALCKTCNQERSSAVIDSPAELENLKELMRQGYEDVGDGWFRKGDVYSKYEDNNLTVCDLAKLKTEMADDDRTYFAPGMQFQERQKLLIKTANYDPPMMLGDGTWIPARPPEENS
jgi:hypothetical protein